MSKFGKLTPYQPTKEEKAILYLRLMIQECNLNEEIYWDHKLITKLKKTYKNRVHFLKRQPDLSNYYIEARVKSFKEGVKANYFNQSYMIDNEINCFFCEKRVFVPEENIRQYDIDHIAPKSLHPEYTFDSFNLVVLCERCNRSLKRDYDTVDKKNKDSMTTTYKIIHPYLDAKNELLKRNKFGVFEIVSQKKMFQNNFLCSTNDLKPYKVLRALKTLDFFEINNSVNVEEFIKENNKEKRVNGKVTNKEFDTLMRLKYETLYNKII